VSNDVDVVYESPRTFQMWRYTVSHSQLLLRSTKEDGGSTRIEILFKNVKAMKVVPLYEGITISEAPDGERRRIVEELPFRDSAPQVWIVKSPSFRGYVAAGAIVTHEDEREYDESSSLLP
jgi:hypothetical protein